MDEQSQLRVSLTGIMDPTESFPEDGSSTVVTLQDSNGAGLTVNPFPPSRCLNRQHFLNVLGNNEVPVIRGIVGGQDVQIVINPFWGPNLMSTTLLQRMFFTPGFYPVWCMCAPTFTGMPTQKILVNCKLGNREFTTAFVTAMGGLPPHCDVVLGPEIVAILDLQWRREERCLRSPTYELSLPEINRVAREP